MTAKALRIWLFKIGEPLPLEEGTRLLRTGLVAKELARRGHEVWWFASAFEHQRKRMLFDADTRLDLPGGIIVYAFRGTGYRSNVSLARYRDHRQVAAKFRRLAPTLPRPDVAAAALPCYFLAAEAVAATQALGVPCLVDVRDPWPDTFIDALPAPARPLGRLMLRPDQRLVRHLLSQATAITAMSPSVLAWALGKAGRGQGPRDRIFFNAYRRPTPAAITPTWLAGLSEKTLVTYVGTFGRSYELPLLLEAARCFARQGRGEVAFVLAGCGDQEKALRGMAADLPNVVLPGWIDGPDIAALLERTAVGVVPCQSVPGALPNKVFEYLAFGVPLVSSLSGVMAENIDREGLGANYQAGDVAGLIAALDRLLLDPVGRTAMSRAALGFYADHGDVDQVYTAYAEHLETLAANGRPRPECPTTISLP